MNNNYNKKFSKTHNKYKYDHLSYSNHLPKFAKFAVKIFSHDQITIDQIVLLHKKLILILINQKIKIWNLCYMNQQLTKLSAESRMGKGKGNVYNHAIFTKPGYILFEIEGIQNLIWLNTIKKIKKKLPFKLLGIKRLIK